MLIALPLPRPAVDSEGAAIAAARGNNTVGLPVERDLNAAECVFRGAAARGVSTKANQCLDQRSSPPLPHVLVQHNFTYVGRDWNAGSFLCLTEGELVTVTYLGPSNSYNKGWCYGVRDVAPRVGGWFPECAVFREGDVGSEGVVEGRLATRNRL